MPYVYVPSETVDKLYEIMDEHIFSSSECEIVVDHNTDNYCPNCGVRMDGVNKYAFN